MTNVPEEIIQIAVHPVQIPRMSRGTGRVPAAVTLRAYEVYAHVYGRQEAMITGGCRGGFGVGELIAFLYAHSFPKAEWRQRVAEALNGMKLQ